MNQNTNQNQGNQNNGENLTFLKKISNLAYTMSGYVPCEASWNFTPDQIKEIVWKQTKTFLDDVKDVTIEVNDRTGAIECFVWLPNTSPNLCNTELQNANSAINRITHKCSKSCNEFMDKYCSKRERGIIPADNRVPLAGIKVATETFLKIECDENGSQFAKKFGDGGTPRRSRLTLTCHFAKNRDGRFRDLQYVHVTKMSTGAKSYHPVPKRSYNAR